MENMLNEKWRNLFDGMDDDEQDEMSLDEAGDDEGDDENQQGLEEFLNSLGNMKRGASPESAHSLGEFEDIEELEDFLDSMNEAPLMGSDSQKELGEDEYHNKGSRLALNGKKREAIDVCIEGVGKYPKNVDLLADIIEYAASIGDYETAEKYYGKLNERVPRNMWNWRAYSFSLDYLMKKPFENEEKCRELIAEYKEALPFEEKSSVAEATLEKELGNHAKVEEILKKAISERDNCPQCALTLLDIQINKGEFEEALKTSLYYGFASAEVQPSTKQEYQLYSQCLAMDALLHKKHMKEGKISKEEVAKIKALYEKINKNPAIAIPFGRNIRNRINRLEFLEILGA